MSKTSRRIWSQAAQGRVKSMFGGNFLAVLAAVFPQCLQALPRPEAQLGAQPAMLAVERDREVLAGFRFPRGDSLLQALGSSLAQELEQLPFQIKKDEQIRALHRDLGGNGELLLFHQYFQGLVWKFAFVLAQLPFDERVDHAPQKLQKRRHAFHVFCARMPPCIAFSQSTKEAEQSFVRQVRSRGGRICQQEPSAPLAKSRQPIEFLLLDMRKES